MDISEIAKIYAGQIQVERECKRRDDLVPNLMNITREYAKHERGLFKYVSDIRSQIGPASGMRGSSQVNTGEFLAKIIALSEQYPDLKASQSFQDLMDMLETTEDRIAAARENYSVAVEEFNLCNQRFWCPFFTYLINFFCPMPAFVNYYYYKSHFTGTWAKLQEPEMIQDEITDKDKMDLLQPVPFSADSIAVTNKADTLMHLEEKPK
jgi:LemA protein